MGIRMRAKIIIAFLSISLLMSFGLVSNQAFAGNGCFQIEPGTPCGDPTDNDCTNPDTCDEQEICQPNHEANGVACGDQTDTQCSNPNSCSGAGVCLAQNEGEGVDCSVNACTDDECDGLGACEEGDPLTTPECSRVGGELIPIETTSLILAGTQSTFSWMIPITVSAIGIAIVVARKFSKYQPD